MSILCQKLVQKYFNDTSFIVICLNNAYKFDVDYSNNNIHDDTECAISLQFELKKNNLNTALIFIKQIFDNFVSFLHYSLLITFHMQKEM